MSNVTLADIGAFAQPEALFVVIVALVVLLSLRAVREVIGPKVTRGALLTLDVSIVILLGVFVALVIVRFATLA